MRLYSNQELYQALSEIGVIPQDKLDEAYTLSKRGTVAFEDLLIDRDLITDINLGKVVADLASFPFIDLTSSTIDLPTVKLVPEVYAKKQNVVAFKRDAQGIHVATTDPSNTDAASFIGKKAGMPVRVYLTTKRGLQDALNLYSKDVARAFGDIIAESIKSAKAISKPADPSIVKIVDTTINYAYQNNASDIHIEPSENVSTIRFRVDGVLHDIVALPVNIHPQIVTRIKVMARLRTDEHQAGQDGRITFKLPEEDLDIRVSIVPVTRGEKIVMRLLSERSRRFSLEELGFIEADLKKVNEARKKPHGMILSTGPTGSGKTTTLYAILKLLNRRDVNIMTIEDPVEYAVEGVNQIQVNAATNLTFAAGLKSIVRQNPDIIFVGEIRDEETANISVNAAMTGHLVLSTLHTNDAATSIPRLLDLGVESYLIASTVNLIIAQRLIRRICLQCRYSFELSAGGAHGAVLSQIPETIIKKYFSTAKRIYKGKGCPVCQQTGYSGREGIFEVLVVDESIRSAIVAKKTASEIAALAQKAGMSTILENGIEKVKKGITTIEEVLRVTKE